MSELRFGVISPGHDDTTTLGRDWRRHRVEGQILTDDAVRRRVYDAVAQRGAPPAAQQLAELTGLAIGEVRDSLRRLAASRILILQAGGTEILMAPPFSAVPTAFLVTTSRHTSYANCAWDAVGVPIMLGEPATVSASCGCCGEAMTIDISPDQPPVFDGVIHFAIPAARWWDDLVFT